MARLDPSVLPPVTDAHRRAAFEAMRWAGWTFEQAMADRTRRQVVETRAHLIRKQEWTAGRRAVARQMARQMTAGLQAVMRQARYTPHVGTPTRPWPPTVQDLKRAAAGDQDD